MDKVLVVDNDPDFLERLKEASLNLHQFDVIGALDGEEALKILSAETISVLVTDVNADKVGGLELLAYISQNNRGVPCVVMSSYGRPWFYKPLEQREILYHVEKPVSMVSLISAILVGLSLRDENGISRGISLSSFLPLLEIERKTCRLEVRSHAKKGFLYFEEGVLIDAHYKDYNPQSAAAEMITWENVSFALGELPRRRFQKRVNVSLMEMAGATWEKDYVIRDGEDEKAIKDDGVSGQSTNIAEKLAVKILNSQIRKFKSIRGYSSIGILDENLEVLADDYTDKNISLAHLLKDFGPVLCLCSETTEKHGFSKCRLFTFHTPSNTIQILYSQRENLPPFYLIGITEAGGNWVFVKFELESLENQLAIAMQKPIIIKNT